MDEIASESGILVSVARTLLQLDPGGVNAKGDHQSGSVGGLGIVTRRQRIAAPGIDEAGLWETPRQRDRFGQPRRAIRQDHLMARFVDFWIDGAAEHDDSIG